MQGQRNIKFCHTKFIEQSTCIFTAVFWIYEVLAFSRQEWESWKVSYDA